MDAAGRGTWMPSPRDLRASGYFRFRTRNQRARDNEEYLTDRLTDEAIGFIRKHRDGLFFLYLTHYAVHIPLQAKPGVVEKYRTTPAGDSPQRNPIYAAMIRSADDGVGKLARALEESGVADRTVII